MTFQKPLVVANWKLNKTNEQSKDYLKEMGSLVKDDESAHFVFFPPALSSFAFNQQDLFSWGVQNISEHLSGAFTGENSISMVKDLGAQFVLIGHSERRSYYLETDELVNKKVKCVLDEKLIPMICIGETLEERENNQIESVLVKQLEGALNEVDIQSTFVLAYEPVWAIGTGKVATAAQAQAAHKIIRNFLEEKYTTEKAKDTTILYGGSVKAGNSKELFSEADIDGFLVGGASLEPNSFYDIYQKSAE